MAEARVSPYFKAEARVGLGVFAFALTLIAIAILLEFPGTVEATDASWATVLGFLLMLLFFYLSLPSRDPFLPPPPPKRTAYRGPASQGKRKRKRNGI